MPKTAYEHIKCGHIFCEACITQWIPNKDSCPNCRFPIKDSIRSIKTENLSLYRFMSKLEINCVNDECDYKGNLGNLEDHLTNKCEFVKIKCKNGCGMRIIRKNIELHETKQCKFRKTECKFCNKLYPICHIVGHIDICENNPDRFRRCKFSKYGCNYCNRGELIKKHEEDSNKEHLELTVKILDELFM